MGRWARRLLVVLAGVAEVGALMPLAVLTGRMMLVQAVDSTLHLAPKAPPDGPSPLALLFVWLGSWAIAAGAPRWRAPLTPFLLVAGAALAWIWVPVDVRPTTPLDPLFLLTLLPTLVASWWGGGRIGVRGLNWPSAYDGLVRSIWLCLGGLLLLMLGGPPPLAAWSGPILLFGAGLTLLYLVRAGVEGSSKRATAAALVPVFLAALSSLLTKGVGLGAVFSPLLRLGALLLEWVMRLLWPIVGFVYRLLTLFQKDPPRELADPEAYYGRFLEDNTGRIEIYQSSFKIGPVVTVLLTVLVVLALFILGRRIAAHARRSGDEESREEVRTGPGFVKGLLADLRALFQPAAPLRAVEPLPAGHPRRLLRRLQGWGARVGRGRHASETPAQYAMALRDWMPPGADPAGLEALTQAYSETRYGTGEPQAVHLEPARRFLEEVEHP